MGTKGPTLTSYLSIPGRFLVMMPYMDNVGVSRKVEDEDLRRQMREILDQLDLPEGFGFILRTAGKSRTKAELTRDLANLQRLWKDMERRLKAGNKPRLLYSEIALLVRALRDMITTDTNSVVIDNENALKRASRFIKIVAPRSSTKLLHYPNKTPMFHAFGIERQIANIHAREVPLPSGGRLVIDQTEALVAIDVNSGKSRESRDSETNAYQTNIEAVDEICRQLRLRDLGGIVINDLIDMRDSKHRKDIENRFKDRLKRDRAKSTILPISEFGILQMTRQRMRASHESVHFSDCPTCRGRGMLQKPESVSADAIRDLSALLDQDKIAKVEMVVAPRIAGELLSTKRQMLSRVERYYGKHVDVRVRETVPVDRCAFYAYDGAGADIEIDRLPQPRKPKDLKPWEDAPPAGSDWAASPADEHADLVEPEPVEEDVDEGPVHPIEVDEGDAGDESEAGGRKRRRRRRRGGRGRDDGGREGDKAAAGESRQQREPREQPREGGREEPRSEESGEGDRDDRGGRGRGEGRGEPRDGQRDPNRDQSREQSRDQQREPQESRSRDGGDSEARQERRIRTPQETAGDHGDDGDVTAAQMDDTDTGSDDADLTTTAHTDGPAGGETGEGGEGGGRKRRRRRRRRGGRGRGEGAEAREGGDNGEQNADDHTDGARPKDEHDEETGDPAESPAAEERRMPPPPRSRNVATATAGDHGDDDDEATATSAGDLGNEPEGDDDDAEPRNGDDRAEGDGPRKKRRRRRRRGGKGRAGEGAADGSGEGSESADRGAPPAESRGDARSEGRGEPRGESRGEPRGDQRSAGGYRGKPKQSDAADLPPVKPDPHAPAKASGGAAADSGKAAPAGDAKGDADKAKPKLLYGALKRKLKPSERNRRAKPE